jgi:signal transduction histidine kinase
VLVQLEQAQSGSRIRVTDNGAPPENMAEGGGLSGMRREVEARGGALRVTSRPQFILEIDLPGGE